MSGSQHSLSYFNSSFLFFTARGAHSARGFIRWVILAWTLGEIKWQNARAARDPISGPSHPSRSRATKKRSAGPDRGFHAIRKHKKNPLNILGSQLKLCLFYVTVGRQARRSCSSQGASPLTPRYVFMRRHPNRQPCEPNEGSGLGGWVNRLVTRGPGMPIPFS